MEVVSCLLCIPPLAGAPRNRSKGKKKKKKNIYILKIFGREGLLKQRPFLCFFIFVVFVWDTNLAQSIKIVHFTPLSEKKGSGYKCNRLKKNSADRPFNLSLFAAVSGFC